MCLAKNMEFDDIKSNFSKSYWEIMFASICANGMFEKRWEKEMWTVWRHRKTQVDSLPCSMTSWTDYTKINRLDGSAVCRTMQIYHGNANAYGFVRGSQLMHYIFFDEISAANNRDSAPMYGYVSIALAINLYGMISMRLTTVDSEKDKIASIAACDYWTIEQRTQLMNHAQQRGKY